MPVFSLLLQEARAAEAAEAAKPVVAVPVATAPIPPVPGHLAYASAWQVSTRRACLVVLPLPTRCLPAAATCLHPLELTRFFIAFQVWVGAASIAAAAFLALTRPRPAGWHGEPQRPNPLPAMARTAAGFLRTALAAAATVAAAAVVGGGAALLALLRTAFSVTLAAVKALFAGACFAGAAGFKGLVVAGGHAARLGAAALLALREFVGAEPAPARRPQPQLAPASGPAAVADWEEADQGWEYSLGAEDDLPYGAAAYAMEQQAAAYREPAAAAYASERQAAGPAAGARGPGAKPGAPRLSDEELQRRISTMKGDGPKYTTVQVGGCNCVYARVLALLLPLCT